MKRHRIRWVSAGLTSLLNDPQPSCIRHYVSLRGSSRLSFYEYLWLPLIAETISALELATAAVLAHACTYISDLSLNTIF
jgi:hypothetical protein